MNYLGVNSFRFYVHKGILSVRDCRGAALKFYPITRRNDKWFFLRAKKLASLES